MKLTIGMSTYDDYDGVFFTIQSLRMHHPLCTSNNVEFVLIDSNSSGSHSSDNKRFIEQQVKGKYVKFEGTKSTFNKYEVVKYAQGDYTLILDCHVLLKSGGIDALISYFKANPDTKNLIQGPLLYDDLKATSTHLDLVWRGNMRGIWQTRGGVYDSKDPYIVDAQGMGLLAFKTSNWPTISNKFRGFGGEEGYIAEKFRQNGGLNICLPDLQWNHRFARPNGVPYALVEKDTVWNYFIGFLDLYKDENHYTIQETLEWFSKRMPRSMVESILQKAVTEYKK